MPWLTNTKTGGIFNTDWTDEDKKQKVGEIISSVASKLSYDNKIKEQQIAKSENEAAQRTEQEKGPNPKEYLDEYVVKNSDVGIGGALGNLKKYMTAKGFTDTDIEDTRKLLSKHSGYYYAEADNQIVKELESGSKLGKALEARIEYEEATYKAWVDKHKDSERPAQYGIWKGEKHIYRKGERKSGVEPWTVKEEGADMGSGAIGVDHETTVEQMFKDGYRLLGGAACHLGSPGEAEMTFVKYRRK